MYTKYQKSELLDFFDTKSEDSSYLLETEPIQNNKEDQNRNSFDDFFGIETSVAKQTNTVTDGIRSNSDVPLKPNFILGPTDQKLNPQSETLKVRHFRFIFFCISILLKCKNEEQKSKKKRGKRYFLYH